MKIAEKLSFFKKNQEKTMIEDDIMNEINKFAVAIATIADDPKASKQHKAETISKCVELFHQTLMERISLISLDETGTT
jgi:hypothetical protein